MPLTACDLKLLAFLLIPIVVMGKSETAKKCPYDYTVDLTGVVPNAKGAYVYGDVEIPSEAVDIYYNYKVLDNGTEIDVTKHARGCICSIKRCLRLCSHESVKFYNKTVNKDVIDFGFTKNITLNNGTKTAIHLIGDFHHIVQSMCDQKYQLDPEMDSKYEWTLFENGTLLRHDDDIYLDREDYCFDIDYFTESGIEYFLVNPYICGGAELPWNFALNGYAMLISIPFFVVTIVFYSCLSHLRTVYGKCFICYLSSLAVSYSMISFLSLSRSTLPGMQCKALGYSIYFSVICYLIWTCVLSYDTWKTLTHMAADSSFLTYSLVGWLVPLLMTLLTYAAQETISDDDLKPGIEDNNCGVNTKRWSACIYYYVPGILVLIYSLTLYIRVLRYIVRNNHNASAYRDEKTQKKRFFLYFRLFIFMGVSWFIDILSYFLNMVKSDTKLAFSIPDFFNASQGLFIFLLFICRRSVWMKIREKVNGRETREHRKINRTSSMELD